MRANKIYIIIVAALSLVACDAHIETPDMTVRPGHVLCDDGTALSYEQYKASGKQAVLSYSTPESTTVWKGTAMPSICGMSPLHPLQTASAWSKGLPLIWKRSMGIRIPSPCMIRGKQLRQWRKRSSTYGATDRARTFHQWQRCACYMRLGRL